MISPTSKPPITESFTVIVESVEFNGTNLHISLLSELTTDLDNKYLFLGIFSSKSLSFCLRFTLETLEILSPALNFVPLIFTK